MDIDFDQILALIKKLPMQEKIRLIKELEKDGIETKLNALLQTFETDELNFETINEEVEIVRQQMHDSHKH